MSIRKSLWKGLKGMGLVGASGALVAIIADPAAVAAVADAAGTLAPVVTLLITFGLNAGLNALKHRNDPPA